jgi:hypothetical protein
MHFWSSFFLQKLQVAGAMGLISLVQLNPSRISHFFAPRNLDLKVVKPRWARVRAIGKFPGEQSALPRAGQCTRDIPYPAWA